MLELKGQKLAIERRTLFRIRVHLSKYFSLANIRVNTCSAYMHSSSYFLNSTQFIIILYIIDSAIVNLYNMHGQYIILLPPLIK